jgi:hypothetical protein
LTWVVVLATSGAFALGWAAGVWQCSRRKGCPRYAEYALAKWKREIVEPQVARRSHRPKIRPRVGRPTPADGGEG